MMGWHDGGVGWLGWVVMSVTMLAFWALLAFGAVTLFRSARGGDSSRDRLLDGRDTARRLLDERYARGEIDETDYTHRRDLLSSDR